MSERDDFPDSVKRVLAERVGYRCCYPDCRAPTTGPHTEPGRRVSVGVAAHVTAAAEGGPRYNPNLTAEKRKAPENGIWMCQTHGTLVDRDEVRFPEPMLREWKAKAEEAADREIGRCDPWTVDANHQGIAFVSEKLSAGVHPDEIALDLLRKHCAAYIRVAQLADQIARLPDSSIVNIPNPIFESGKRALVSKFAEEHVLFEQDMKTALTILDVVCETDSDDGGKASIQALISAANAVVNTVREKLARVQGEHVRNASGDAAEASARLNRLIAQRMIALSQRGSGANR